jgi:cyclase
MAKWQYTKGAHDLGNGCFAYLQPDGTWGWSNAGLVADGGETLLVDTLFDLKLTRAMLEAFRKATPAAAKIDVLVNTHANVDHTLGNQLVGGARIIASARCAKEMLRLTPAQLLHMVRNWRTLGEGAAFFYETMGSKFDFEGITLTLPTETFEGERNLRVGAKEVRLIEMGPAHTQGDTIIHVPADRTVFTGDLLFAGGTPVVWAGPIANWLKACDFILKSDVETIVPGHGPISDKSAVKAQRDYLVFVRDEAKKRFDAGLGIEEAAYDIALGPFGQWTDSERIVVNVASLYREFRGAPPPESDEPLDLFGAMRRYRHAHAHAP